jgi:hypothetical protein
MVNGEYGDQEPFGIYDLRIVINDLLIAIAYVFFVVHPVR